MVAAATPTNRRLFGLGFYSVAVGSALLTVYLTGRPWRYTGQNYGLALVFLRRRGIPVRDGHERWLYASFVSPARSPCA